MHVLIIQARLARSCKRAGHPRVLVRELPHHDTHALGRIQACVRDRHIILGLLRDRGGIGWQRHANVQFGDGDFDTEADEAVEHGHEVLRAGRAAHSEVALETNAVDACARVLHQTDNVEGGVGLCAVELEGEVVVVQLGGRVGGGGGAEGDGDEVGAEGGEEDAVAKCAVSVVESLVNDVPGIARAFVVADYVGNVGLDGGREGIAGPLCGCDWTAVNTECLLRLSLDAE